MKKVFVALMVIASVAACLGFYRGWFTLSRSSPDAQGNKVNVSLTVDGEKMQQDAEAVKAKTTSLTDNVAAGEKNSTGAPAHRTD